MQFGAISRKAELNILLELVKEARKIVNNPEVHGSIRSIEDLSWGVVRFQEDTELHDYRLANADANLETALKHIKNGRDVLDEKVLCYLKIAFKWLDEFRENECYAPGGLYYEALKNQCHTPIS